MTELFTETKKALDTAENIETKARETMPYDDQLKLLEEHKNHADNREDYEAYEEQIKEIKNEIAFDPWHLKLSDEERSKIENNYKIERDEAQEEYQKAKNDAVKAFNKAMKNLEPLLDRMAELNNEIDNVSRIETVLSGLVDAKPSKDGRFVHAPVFQFYREKEGGKKGVEAELPVLLKEIGKAIEQPENYKCEDTGMIKGIREK